MSMILVLCVVASIYSYIYKLSEFESPKCLFNGHPLTQISQAVPCRMQSAHLLHLIILNILPEIDLLISRVLM
jgi:hypothetical protein